MTFNKILFFFFVLFNVYLETNAIAESSPQSIFNADTKWKNEKNNEFFLSELKGKKFILAMTYTSCQGSCPMTVSKLKRTEKLFEQKNIPIDVVLITFDPAVDTPEKHLSFYREKMGIKKTNWHFLTGTTNETRKFSMLLGIKYSMNPLSKIINHDNKILLINENGEIEKMVESLSDNESMLLN